MTDTTIKKDPFDFLFFFYECDTRERKENALLVGGDDPSTASPLHLAIDIKEATQIVIRPISGVTTASSSNYHFKLQFPGGILLQPEQITVQDNDWDLKVEGNTILYLLWKKQEEFTLNDSNSLELMLNGVLATLTPEVRTSRTNVTLSWEFKRDNIIFFDVTAKAPSDGDSTPYNNSATETLEMIQRLGKANIPLYVGFFSSNRVLNTNNQESHLKLRITNTSESPITFNYNADATNRSQLIVALEVGDAGTVPWALATADQLNNVDVSIVGNQWQKTAGPENKGSTLEWTFTPQSGDVELAAKDTLVVELSKIVTRHPTGTANLYLRYKYLPDYQDGEFICPIEKAPLVFPEKNVGIGTTTPAENLHIQGGNLRLDDVSGGGEIRSKGPLVFRSDVDKSGDDYVAKFYKQDASAPLMVLNKDGNVGIGTFTPESKLHIVGASGGGDSGSIIIERNGQADILYKDTSANQTWQAGIDSLGWYIYNTAHRLVIKENGNVGIGTTMPGAKLHVNGGDAIFSGNLKFGQTTRQMINLYEQTFGIGVQHSTMYFRTNTQFAWYKGGSHNDDLAAAGGGTLQMMLDTSGNLGIGTTSPLGKLHVNGGNAIFQGGHVGIGTDSPNTAQLEIIGTGTTFYSANSSKGNQVTIKNGNLGLGTNDPKGKLDVHGGKIRINGGPAMKYFTYDLSNISDNYDTGVITQDWIACIAGFSVNTGSPITGLRVRAIKTNSPNWILSYDGIGGNDNGVLIYVLFIRREFFNDDE